MNLIGGDYDTPHTFSAGDTISADMMNEIFDYIKLSKTVILSSDLVLFSDLLLKVILFFVKSILSLYKNSSPWIKRTVDNKKLV